MSLNQQDLPKVVVTKSDGLRYEEIAETSPLSLNVLIVPMSIAKRLFIRTLKVYLSTLLGLLGVSVASVVVPVQSPVELTTFIGTLQNAALLSIAPAVVNLLFNLYILVNELDRSTPELMA